MVNASRWEKNEQVVLKGLSEHFSEKMCRKGGGTGQGVNN